MKFFARYRQIALACATIELAGVFDLAPSVRVAIYAELAIPASSVCDSQNGRALYSC